ncbi:MAG: type II secretion system F family protein [Candidatus Omnitrophota bacterium]
MIFKYIAKDSAGKTVSGVLEAEDRQRLIENLRKQDLVIISITEEQSKLEAKKKFTFTFRKKIKPDELVIFSRQLATMVDAGIPLSQSIRVLGEEMENIGFKAVLKKVNDDIQTGLSLSDAFARHQNVFSSFFINMVKAGETSGTLNTILDRIASYLEKTQALARKVRAALIYPLVVSLMAVAITAALLLFVVPTFKNIFTVLGGKLPLPTQILISTSDVLRRYFLIVVGAFIVIGILLGRVIRTEIGRFHFDRVMLKLPIFGTLFRKIAIAKFSRTLSTLVKSGVAILSAIEIVSKTSGNKVIERTVLAAGNNVREGEPFSAPLERSGLFPPMVIRMISVGEKTGELEKMLTKIADFYDEQVDAAVTGLTAMIEPLIIGFLGIVVGFIVLSMFLPILKLTQLVGR